MRNRVVKKGNYKKFRKTARAGKGEGIMKKKRLVCAVVNTAKKGIKKMVSTVKAVGKAGKKAVEKTVATAKTAGRTVRNGYEKVIAFFTNPTDRGMFVAFLFIMFLLIANSASCYMASQLVVMIGRIGADSLAGARMTFIDVIVVVCTQNCVYRIFEMLLAVAEDAPFKNECTRDAVKDIAYLFRLAFFKELCVIEYVVSVLAVLFTVGGANTKGTTVSKFLVGGLKKLYGDRLPEDVKKRVERHCFKTFWKTDRQILAEM